MSEIEENKSYQKIMDDKSEKIKHVKEKFK